MKTEFELEISGPKGVIVNPDLKIKIIGTSPHNHVYVAIDEPEGRNMFIQDKDLERFAVNILKAIKSKKLKP